MKVRNESIVVTGNDIDDIARYPLSKKFDRYLSEVLSTDIEYDQDNINKFLEWSLDDWYDAPKDYAPDDNVPRELKEFKSFIRTGKRLSAQQAALILRYTGEEFAEERAMAEYLLPSDFARDIAVASILHTAIHTEKADLVPVLDLPIYREVQAMPDREAARQAWIKTILPYRKPRYDAYWNELKRKEAAETAGESLGNAQILADEFGFSLSSAVKTYLARRTPRRLHS